jgi:hypothetical protein
LEVRIVLGVVENFILGVTVERAGLFSDLTSEPIMPALEAIVRLTSVAYEIFVRDTFQCLGAKPAIRSIVHMLKGIGGIQHLTIFVVNGAQEVVDFSQSEESATKVSIEQIDDQGVEGDTDDIEVREGGRSSSDFSELVKEIIIGDVAVDSFAGRKGSDASVFVGDVFVDIMRNLVESTLKVHLGYRVFSNPLPQFFNLSDRSVRNVL